MSSQILTTKLYIPTSRSQTVSRLHLIDRLNQGLQARLTLVCAPAGFGKTTLISEWLSQCEHPSAWLSLDEQDNAPKRFLTYVIEALQTIAPHIDDDLLKILQSPQPPVIDTLLISLINSLATIPDTFILVLDDYHVLDTKEIDTALTFLLDNLPPQMHIVITTREDPQVPLAKYRARAELTEIRAKDLRFSSEEIHTFLNDIMGLDLPHDSIIALENRTEGWIASLQMAAISLQGQDDKTQFIEAFTGSHRFIMDYLLEEVLNQQPTQLRKFLTQTSILTRLNANLCDAVTETQDSQLVLEQLEQRNLFISPLDNSRQWFRYHHLFADALRARLKRESHEAFSAVHQRSSQWYEENEYIMDALRHAFLAEDEQRASRLLELIWSEMDLSYQSARWLKWAKQLSEDIILTRPVMCLGYAWALINEGDFQTGEKYLQHAEKYIAHDLSDVIVHDVEQWKSLPASIISARAYIAMAMGQVEQTIHYAKQSLKLSTDPMQTSHRQASALLGFASWATGDLQSADLALEKYLLSMNYLGSAIIAYIADLRIQLGRMRDANVIYQDSLKRIDNFPPLGTEELYRGLAEFQLELGNLDDAKKYLDISQSLGEQMAILTWEQRFAVTEAWYYVMLGEYNTALERLEFAEMNYLQTAMPDIRPITAQKARIWIQQGQLDRVDQWASQLNNPTTNDFHYLEEYEHLTLVRYLIAQYRHNKHIDEYNQAMTLTTQLLSAAKSGSRFRSGIEILILQAKLAAISDDLEYALSILNQALDLAQPQGYVALFITEGNVVKFILQQSDHLYAKSLLSYFPDTSKKIETTGNLDNLSQREIDVLQQMAEGLTNPEIAERLYISKHTVKVHTRNLYSKLDVNNRTQAVTKARSLGIISE